MHKAIIAMMMPVPLPAGFVGIAVVMAGFSPTSAHD